MDRFLREGRSVAGLRDPGIVPVYDVGQADNVPYLVSEFVSGTTLADRLPIRRFTFHEVAELIASVAESLQHAHEQGVVHRDVKPSNIMIETDGTSRLMDFGLAKREAGEITMTIEGQVLGTPAYMSPEQAGGDAHKVDGRSDVYSLGVILYELLTGELPFRGNKRMLIQQVLHEEPQSPRALNDHIPRDLETICLKCMEKAPGKRYSTAEDLAVDLRRFIRGEPILTRPRKRRAMSFLAVFIILLLAYLYLEGWSSHQGSKQLHTMMTEAATLIAFVVGILALLHFYSKKENTFLFIGSGFIGTALLDGYYAVATSDLMDFIMPSPPDSLIPWSWSASRTFLALVMALSWWAWRRENKLGAEGRIREGGVYAIVLGMTLVSFCFFALVPLPRAYYPEFLFARPQEFVPATFFLVALIGYLKKGQWRRSSFEYWLVISLIIGVMSQALFMPRSFSLFDVMFDAGHLLKIASYVCVLVGLLATVYLGFRARVA